MQSPLPLSLTLALAIATAGCQPDILIASNEPQTSGAGGLAVAGGGSDTGGSDTGGSDTGGTSGVGGTSEPPGGGDAGAVSVPEPPRLLADSVADFSLTQEERGWSYGYDSGSLDTFALMTRKSVITNYVPPSNDVWDCWGNDTAHWTQIFQLGAHPNGTETSTPSNSILQRAVRRWTSTYAGDVTIVGEIAKIDLIGSNGVDAFVYVDGVQRYTTLIAGDDGGGRSYKIVATLKVGSTVDFVLDPHEGADHHDLARFTGIIVRVEPGPAP
jgi:hypothetical protein